MVRLTETIGSKTYTYNYTYNDDQIATGVTYGATSESIAFDSYGRTSSTTIKNNSTARLTTSYAYNSIGGYTTNQVGTLNNNYETYK